MWFQCLEYYIVIVRYRPVFVHCLLVFVYVFVIYVNLNKEKRKLKTTTKKNKKKTIYFFDISVSNLKYMFFNIKVEISASLVHFCP